MATNLGEPITERPFSHGDLSTLIDTMGNTVQHEVESALRNPGFLTTSTHERIRQAKEGMTKLLVDYRRNPEMSFPPQSIRQIRAFYQSPYPEVQTLERDNIAKLIVLDERNAENGKRIGVREEVAAEILQDLRSHSTDLNQVQGRRQIFHDETEIRTRAYTLACGKSATREIMNKVLEQQEALPLTFWQVFGNALGFETARAYVAEYARSHPQTRAKIERLSQSFGLDAGEQAFFDLGEFYKAVKFEGYKPYEQLQETDTNFLLEQLQGRQRVIDVGCGEGRHMIPLIKAGIPVQGVEITLDMLPHIQAQVPDAIVHAGSMNNLPFDQASVDAIYLMGRTLTHITDVMEAIAIFKEFKRVLKKDGIVLFDLPNLGSREMSQYRQQRRQFLWDKLHIWNTETGTIHDTPDGKHFIDRSVLDIWQVDAIARLAGFDAEMVQEVPYKGALGEEAKNVYWKLTDQKLGSYAVEVNEMEPLAHTSFGRKGTQVDIDLY